MGGICLLLAVGWLTAISQPDTSWSESVYLDGTLSDSILARSRYKRTTIHSESWTDKAPVNQLLTEADIGAPRKSGEPPPKTLESQALHQPQTPSPTVDLHPWRLTLVSGLSLSGMAGSYVYLQTAWWKENTQGFHFANDFVYAKNLDKVAHFHGGAFSAQLFYDGLKWSGLREEPALLYGAAFGTLLQLGIEVKDGYAPTWGFSVFDVVLGTAGSFYPYLKRKLDPNDYFHLKMSYYIRDRRYYEESRNGVWVDDYSNQTYWASFHVKKFLPGTVGALWPGFLNIALGAGVDKNIISATNGTRGVEGNYELILALDYDLPRLFRPKHAGTAGLLYYLNLFKLPAPAVKWSAGELWWGIYF